jgi:hypothetical protein
MIHIAEMCAHMELDGQVGLVKPAIQVRDAVSRNLDPRGKRALLRLNGRCSSATLLYMGGNELGMHTPRGAPLAPRGQGATPRPSCGNAGQSRGFAVYFLPVRPPPSAWVISRRMASARDGKSDS